MTERQRSIVQVRLTPEDRERVKIAAKRERRTVSAWVRAVVLDELDALDRKPTVTGERDRKRGKESGAQRRIVAKPVTLRVGFALRGAPARLQKEQWRIA